MKNKKTTRVCTPKYGLFPSKRSQVTIFVIIALVIVVAIALIFLLVKNKTGITTINPVENTKGYIENCLKNNLDSIEKKLFESNFYPELEKNFMVYYNKKVPYLCKSSQFYSPCIAQEPSLAGYLRRQIVSNINAEKCIADAINALRLADYTVSENLLNISIEFTDKEIIVELNKKISVKKNDESKSYEKFYAKIQSPIYNLAKTANTIVNYESTLCEFNIIGWMAGNSDILIKRFTTSDGTKVYTLIDEDTQKQINFAVRTCVLPAGL